MWRVVKSVRPSPQSCCWRWPRSSRICAGGSLRSRLDASPRNVSIGPGGVVIAHDGSLREMSSLRVQPKCVPRVLRMGLEDRAHEIAELPRREVLAFDCRRKPALTIDDGRLQRVRDQPFLRPVLNPERVADALDFRGVAGQEAPTRSA